MKTWIGIDLDGTLAMQDGKGTATHIGKPIIPMVEQTKKLLEAGCTVKIFTARVAGGKEGFSDSHEFQDVDLCRKTIIEWCKMHIGQELEVTNIKDGAMSLLIDDKAINCSHNTGHLHPNPFGLTHGC